MVEEVETLYSVLWQQRRRTLNRAWKGSVGGIKRRLPHLRELVQDIRHGCLIGFVVHKEDNALSHKDQRGESRPVVDAHGDLGRDVS